MDISVIFATYNRGEILSRTLESFCLLNSKGINWEVIVVDNANDLNTQRLISGFHDKLPIKCLVEERRGKNHALNKAIEIAEGDLFIFTDDDVLADRNWLIEMWEGSKRWPDFSIFGGRILPEFPPGKIPISKRNRFYNNAYVNADWNIDEGEYSSYKVWGPNMAIRSKIFHDGWEYNTNIGPNGNNYIMGSETELLLRLEMAGLRAIYLPKSLVYHIIRPEQLDLKWLYGRAFRIGKMQAYRMGRANVTYLFKVPRYLYRQLIETAIKRIFYFFDRDQRNELAMNYWMIRGIIHQYQIDSNPK